MCDVFDNINWTEWNSGKLMSNFIWNKVLIRLYVLIKTLDLPQKDSTPGSVAFLEMPKNLTSSAFHQMVGTWLVCKGLLSHRDNGSPISIAKRRSNFCPVDSCRLALGRTLCAYLDLSSILISRDQIWRDHVRYHLCVKKCLTVLRKPDRTISWTRRHSLHPLSSSLRTTHSLTPPTI